MKKLVILSTILMTLVCFNINEAISASLQKQTVTIPTTGKVQKFPDGWYQIFLTADDATGTTFWLHAPESQVNCMDMPVIEMFGVAPKSVSFLDDQESKRLILAKSLPLIQWAVQKCRGAPWINVWIVYEDYQLLREKPKNSSYY